MLVALIANYILSTGRNIKSPFKRFTDMPVIKFLSWIVFIAFVILLTKKILFKKSPGYYKNNFRREYTRYSVKEGWEKANTKPFSTIQRFYNSRNLNPEYKQDNLLGNLLGFAPFGIFLPFLIPWFRKGIYTLLAGFFISLGFEMTQLLFGLGIFDVDDILLNTSGCFIGYILFWIAGKILQSPNRSISQPRLGDIQGYK